MRYMASDTRAFGGQPSLSPAFHLMGHPLHGLLEGYAGSGHIHSLTFRLVHLLAETILRHEIMDLHVSVSPAFTLVPSVLYYP